MQWNKTRDKEDFSLHQVNFHLPNQRKGKEKHVEHGARAEPATQVRLVQAATEPHCEWQRNLPLHGMEPCY